MMGITKAKVLPLPVTCEMRNGISPSSAPETNREKQEAPPVHNTHRFRSDVFVTHEERNGGGLEEKHHRNSSTGAAGSINEPKFPPPPQEPPELSRNHPSEGTAEGRPQGCDRAPAQRSQGPELPFLPPPWGRGLPPDLHRGHAGEAEAPQRPQDTGAERHGQRLPAPLRHRLHPGPVPPPGPFPLTASGRGGAPPETRPAELWFRPCATPRGSPRYHKKIPFLREIAPSGAAESPAAPEPSSTNASVQLP